MIWLVFVEVFSHYVHKLQCFSTYVFVEWIFISLGFVLLSISLGFCFCYLTGLFYTISMGLARSTTRQHEKLLEQHILQTMFSHWCPSNSIKALKHMSHCGDS